MAACFRVYLVVALNFYTIIVFHVAVAEAQTCILGLPSNASLCTSPDTSCGPREEGGSRIRTRIIPEISFTCSGIVTGWRAAGVIRSGGNARTNSVLSIWRERSSESGTYDRVSGIELGICGDEDPAPSVMSNIYECILSQTVSVQPGYIVGIELPQENRSKFRLYFNFQGGQTNYVFDGHDSTFSMSQALSSEETSDQPQISLTIVPDIMTTIIPVLPTTQPSTMTEASSTMAGLTTQPPVTSTPMATTDLETPTSTEASSTMAATTDLEAPTSTEVLITTAAATDPSTSLTTALATDPSTTTTTEASTITMSAETQPSTPTGAPTTDTAVMTNINLESTTAGSITTEIPSSAPPRGDEAVQPESDIGTVAGSAVGAIIAVLLVLIIILLLVLVLRRQSRNRQKFTPSNSPTIVNPSYDANHTSGMMGVSSTNGTDHMPQGDYEYIDEGKPIIPPQDFAFSSPNHDYSKPRMPQSFEMTNYELPVQSTMSKNLMPEHSFGDVGVLYVPSQEQRKSLPKNGTNGDVYSTIGMRQYSESGAAPKLFEEDETYWEPASDANELYKQLSTKKYREIVRQQIQITSHLGSGQFGTVNKGIWQSPMGAMDVAVKQLQPGASEEEKVKFLQEAAINGQFRHPNVVKLMGVVTVGEPTMIVLEMLSNGDLLNYLRKLQPSPGEILPSNTQQLLLKSCQQIASGMEYLARKAFVHRDLAARNILVADDKTCKISDFGMSRDLMDENYYVSHGGKVPVKWTAPEALHYKKYSTASDVWSYGCVMYEIWSLGHKPFATYRNPEVIKMVDKGYRLPPPPGLTKELYKIMIQCWHPDRSSRPTFPQLVEMLSRPDFELFVWEEEDLRNSDPQVKLIGAPLELAKNLYHELQSSYLSS